MSASTDQSGITGSVPGATGHWHNGSWYTNNECKCALSQSQSTASARKYLAEAVESPEGKQTSDILAALSVLYRAGEL